MAGKLTLELVNNVEHEIGNGNFRTLAFARLGVSRGAWKKWIAIGDAARKDPDRLPPGCSPERAELCVRLITAVERAEGQAHGAFLNDLNTLVVNNDRDRIALLKLRLEFYKCRYGKLYSRNPNAIDDDTGETVKVDAVEVFRDMMSRLVENRRAEIAESESDAEGSDE